MQFDLFSLPLFYVAATLAVIFAAWLSSAWGQVRRRRRERRNLCQCRLCAAWLRHEGRVNLLRCPVCGALNEPGVSNDI
jgi:uncharacterized paraquat-inducible protein A